LIKTGKYDQIITCGPERMMKKVIDLALENDIKVQASLERFMKCGIGICDACAVNGLHVCKDGPVFNGELLLKLSDFCRWRRDASGKRIKIE
jgi:dihydroorotate dehydrogenase electron transfer subunit